MNWISRWKKIGIKVKQIFKKQPSGQEETDWKNCPQCKKITYKPDLFKNSYICECSFHFDLPPKLRLEYFFDSNYEIIEAPNNINPDPLNFEVKAGAREGYKYIDKIKNKQDLTFQESKAAFEILMEGKANDQEIFDFLTFLSIKGEASDEIAGGVYVLRDKSKRVNVDNCVDTCGTGGDGMNTLNISTA